MRLRFLLLAILVNMLPAAGVSAQPTPGREFGRYQIFFSPHVRADTFLVDTQTGKVWQVVKYSDLEGDPNIWVPMDRVDNDAQLGQWMRGQTRKREPSKPAKAQKALPLEELK
jgi:hypothetical protein